MKKLVALLMMLCLCVFTVGCSQGDTAPATNGGDPAVDDPAAMDDPAAIDDPAADAHGDDAHGDDAHGDDAATDDPAADDAADPAKTE